MIQRNCGVVNETNSTTVRMLTDATGAAGYDAILSHYPPYRVSLALYHYLLPIIIILGTSGNVLSFIVMTGEKFRNNSTCIFLAALAVFDTLVLFVSGARYWIGKITDVDIKMLNDPMCKLFGGFLYHFVRHVSVWIVVGVTVDRFMLITFPLKTRSIQPRRRALLGLMAIFGVFLVTDLTTVWSYEIIEDCLFKKGDFAKMTTQTRCYTNVFRNAWSWVDLCVYSFIPTTLLLVMNIRLMYTIIRRDKQKKTYNSKPALAHKPVVAELSDLPSGSSGNPERPLTGSTSRDEESDRSSQRDGSLLKKHDHGTTTAKTSTQGDRKKNAFMSNDDNSFQGLKNVHFTTLLPLIVSFSFIICTTPITVIEILYARNYELGATETANVRLIRTSFFMLMYLNHSINLLLYCISGTTFRTELVGIFKRCFK